ncbi:MAG: segregation/condensation protein A [Treponema sp.]|jgi:segregation and condensation protein A|nr:segregation/condensation protein A [Treponema sp.]
METSQDGIFSAFSSSDIKASRSFTLNKFEGPLDLLLFLIKKNEVNIYDIPIAKITEQYLDYLYNSTELDLEEASEFHSMASTLLLIKSRMLLPIEMNTDNDDEDPRQELVERLIEYQKFKKFSILMEEKEKEAEWIIERKRSQRLLPFADEDLWEKADVWDLLKIFSEYTRFLSNERVFDFYEEVTINEKIALLYEILENRKECCFGDLLIRTDSPMEFVCAFLAILEVVRQHMVSVFQNRMFGDIVIRLNDKVLNDET